MKNYNSTKAINNILSAFENGNLPQAIAYSTFTPPENIPAYKWSQRNRALAFMQGTGDARGFNQWKEAGRYVKKGAKSIYILGPVLIKSKDPVDIETEEDETQDNRKLVGYRAIPVFRMEDTEGEPVEYANLEVKKLPLADVAEKWGLQIIAGSFNGEYYGYYSPSRNEIVMATDNERTFLHELSHAAHYRIDPKAVDAPKWQKEIIAELSASALLYMLGKDGHLGNHYEYIKNYAEMADMKIEKACLSVLDTCIKVIEAITSEAENFNSLQIAA